MSTARDLPKRIVLLGDGQVAVLTAIALRRALPSTEVLVLGVPPTRLGMADQMGTALPFSSRLHDRLGIEESDLIRHAGASHRLVMRYYEFGDAAGAADYQGDFQAALVPKSSSAWDAAQSVYLPTMNEYLANDGRFAVDEAGDMEYGYGLRWNVAAYRDLLIQRAQQVGIHYIAGPIAAVDTDEAGGIQSVKIAGTDAITADLFIDCCGVLMDAVSNIFVDWSAMLPTRQIWWAKPGAPVLALEDRVTLTDKGWLAETAGRDGHGRVFGSWDLIDANMAAAFLGAEPEAMVALTPRRRTQAWVGNVVALGDAFAEFEPLGYLNLDLAHRQLALLLDMLPGRDIDPEERNAFNRRATLMANGARDAVAAHFAGPRAQALLPDLQLSQELSIMVDQFQRRRRAPFFEESPFSSSEWLSLLNALGLPSKDSVLAQAGPAPDHQAAEAYHADCVAKVTAMPAYADWLRSLLEQR